MNILIVGAGFTGAVIARKLAESGMQITIIDQRSHRAGNCYTERDLKTGVMEHVSGPHIFHTDDKEVWDFLNQHGELVPFINRVKSIFSNKVYSLPVNLHTINQFYDKAMSPVQAKEFIKSVGKSDIVEPENFDNYFNHAYQGIPKDGYTPIVDSILDHPLIQIKLNQIYKKNMQNEFNHIIWTGKLDEWFDYSFGRLTYRTLRFEKHYAEGDFQGNAVINYGDESVPYTRISEHKHFAPWEEHEQTIYFKEYSGDCGEKDIPYYPVRLADDKDILQKYEEKAKSEKNVTFAGRLGTYSYMDMDVTIRQAFDIADKLKLTLNT